jgi:hypothetical protein
MQRHLDGDEREIASAHETPSVHAPLGIGYDAVKQRLLIAPGNTNFPEDIENLDTWAFDRAFLPLVTGAIAQPRIDQAAHRSTHDRPSDPVLGAKCFHAFGQILIGFEPGENQPPLACPIRQ